MSTINVDHQQRPSTTPTRSGNTGQTDERQRSRSRKRALDLDGSDARVRVVAACRGIDRDAAVCVGCDVLEDEIVTTSARVHNILRSSFTTTMKEERPDCRRTRRTRLSGSTSASHFVSHGADHSSNLQNMSHARATVRDRISHRLGSCLPAVQTNNRELSLAYNNPPTPHFPSRDRVSLMPFRSPFICKCGNRSDDSGAP